MKRIILQICMLLIVCIASPAVIANAVVGITLNGSYSDWSDKPYLNDTVGDETARLDIKTVRWYPDNTKGYLYFYTERVSSGNTDWSFSNYLNCEYGNLELSVYYKRANGTVNVTLYDANGYSLWSAGGRWGDIKTPGTKVEYFVPLTELVSTVSGGYEINAYLQSGNDFSPNYDGEFITISSVSTGPILITVGLIIVNVIGVILYRRFRVIK